jgi:uncharacterized membrane protein
MRRAVLFLTAVTVAAGLCIGADAQQGRGTFTYETIDFPGATLTQVTGINAQGDLVGLYTLGGTQSGFLLSNGEFETINAPAPAYYTSAWGLSADGQVVGAYRSAGVPPSGCPAFLTYLQRGFVWSAGDFQTLHVADACYTVAYDINARGDVVGEYGDLATNLVFGFLLRGNVFTQIDIPNPEAQVPWSAVMGINSHGDMVGWYGDGATSRFKGYLLRNGEVTTFDVPGGTNIAATAINDRDEVAIRVNPSTPVSYIWRNGELTPFAFPGADYTNVLAMNNRGDLGGWYMKDGVRHGFVAYKWTNRQD